MAHKEQRGNREKRKPKAAEPKPKTDKDLRPGAVELGSKKDSQIAPTLPTVPVNKEPPPEISATSAASGAAGTGES